jgi:hypothetical protein
MERGRVALSIGARLRRKRRGDGEVQPHMMMEKDSVEGGRGRE